MSEIVTVDDQKRIKIPVRLRPCMDELMDADRQVVFLRQRIAMALRYIPDEELWGVLNHSEQRIVQRVRNKTVEKAVLLSSEVHKQAHQVLASSKDEALLGLGSVLNANATAVSCDSEYRIVIPKTKFRSHRNLLLVNNPKTPEIEIWIPPVWACVNKIMSLGVPVLTQTPIDRVIRQVHLHPEKSGLEEQECADEDASR